MKGKIISDSLLVFHSVHQNKLWYGFKRHWIQCTSYYSVDFQSSFTFIILKTSQDILIKYTFCIPHIKETHMGLEPHGGFELIHRFRAWKLCVTLHRMHRIISGHIIHECSRCIVLLCLRSSLRKKKKTYQTKTPTSWISITKLTLRPASSDFICEKWFSHTGERPHNIPAAWQCTLLPLPLSLSPHFTLTFTPHKLTTVILSFLPSLNKVLIHFQLHHRVSVILPLCFILV